jgi:hypothetical protein
MNKLPLLPIARPIRYQISACMMYTRTAAARLFVASPTCLSLTLKKTRLSLSRLARRFDLASSDADGKRPNTELQVDNGKS